MLSLAPGGIYQPMSLSRTYRIVFRTYGISISTGANSDLPPAMVPSGHTHLQAWKCLALHHVRIEDPIYERQNAHQYVLYYGPMFLMQRGRCFRMCHHCAAYSSCDSKYVTK